MKQTSKLLTIAIPTYNRSQKLVRLLSIIINEINSYELNKYIDILISDNSENALTKDAISEFSHQEINLDYYKQPQNIGADKNIFFLYEKCITNYIWFISDDDFPLEGSLKKILSALVENKPEVLLFSFIQPPGSKNRQFNYSDKLHIIENPISMIDSLLVFPKLSIYVIKKISFSEDQIKLLSNSQGEGWPFLYLGLNVLEKSTFPKVAIYSEALVTADSGYTHIWIPEPFMHWHKLAGHPYIQKNNPGLETKMKKQGYLQCILFSWAIRKGVLTIDDNKGLELFIKRLKWDFSVLFFHPKIFLQFIFLKFRII